jgi:hypothetical protein
LAAAYAEAGRFAEAISTTEAAQQLAASAGQKAVAAKCSSLLDTLKSGKPWREAH